jgi:hypothetical protein
MLTASRAVSTAARIGWGYAGDRWFDHGMLLGWPGICSGCAFVALGSLPWLTRAGTASSASNDARPVVLSVAAAMAAH